MEHARDLWNNWRGDLNRQFVKPARNMQQAIKNCPKGIKQPDWEWLVKEHFYSKDFIDRSKRNSKNRSNLKILHHSGSKPYRQIIWDNGGKENNPPTLDKLFSLTHMKDGTFVDSETSTKHAEIEVERLLNPTLSNCPVIIAAPFSTCPVLINRPAVISAPSSKYPIFINNPIVISNEGGCNT
ncbi:uncharacterized protein LOC8074289 [Sorghum bicolor]|uniref:uncharacterized protein LOC8074289 n=1 Tax=Sorghum bicolor TaxID=4558 RepID=UPI000B424497|nr:uncharacterized protein LOC8074289 [Sorghum bicolor]|eukprot:XP_021321792.1 uncharacterized protein LOC8074289 [Sorghum bicolor]